MILKEEPIRRKHSMMKMKKMKMRKLKVSKSIIVDSTRENILR